MREMNPPIQRNILQNGMCPCEASVDDLHFFQSELDGYLVSCPRFCMGKLILEVLCELLESMETISW